MEEAGRLAVARLWQPHLKIRPDAPGILPQHDDAVGKQYRFFDVVRDDVDRPRGNRFVCPELQRFTAQILRCQHVERGEGLVHEEHLRLDYQRPGEADALFHTAGKLFRIGSFEAVEANSLQNFQRAFAAGDFLQCPAPSEAPRRFRAPSAMGTARSSETQSTRSAIPPVCRAKELRRARASKGRSACAGAWTCPSRMAREPPEFRPRERRCPSVQSPGLRSCQDRRRTSPGHALRLWSQAFKPSKLTRNYDNAIAKLSRAASMVREMSASLWAVETKRASYCDGGR